MLPADLKKKLKLKQFAACHKYFSRNKIYILKNVDAGVFNKRKEAVTAIAFCELHRQKYQKMTSFGRISECDCRWQSAGGLS